MFLVLGWVTLILGIIGMFLPLLPTTPFALLAAYFFSKGSERMHQWLLRQPAIGPLIREWRKHGIIKRPAKVWSTLMIIPLFAYTLIFVNVMWMIKVIIAASAIAVLSFIWTRPSSPKINRPI
jgi:uncharacterized membrane protein YbaN (DUF454 family)